MTLLILPGPASIKGNGNISNSPYLKRIGWEYGQKVHYFITYTLDITIKPCMCSGSFSWGI